MKRLAAAVAGVFCVAVVAQAGAKLGTPAPKFSGLESTSGKAVSLDDFDRDVLVLCITCNHCPVAVAVEDRLIDFSKKHCGPDGKVDFVAINVNNMEADKLPAMKERADAKGFNFIYAYDPSQQVAKDLGATRTPEFFVFNKDRKLVYTGAMDDNAMEPDKAKVNYLEQACKAVLNGASPPDPTKPVGCGIKFE